MEKNIKKNIYMAEYIWLNNFAVQQKLIQIVNQLYFNKKI